MFWRRGPTTEQKAEAVKEKRESNDELFNHFMLCRALSLQSQECYQEHGTDAAQCRRSMEEENLCWGYPTFESSCSAVFVLQPVGGR